MRKLIFGLAVLMTSHFTATAQEEYSWDGEGEEAATEEVENAEQKRKEFQSLDCYEKYSSFFAKRGAFEVGDDLHRVVITVRTENQVTCYMGKARVRDGFVAQVQRTLADDTYEDFKPEFKQEFDVTIYNGVSRTQVTKTEEMVNYFFIDKVKPKKQGYLMAPEPDFEEDEF